MGAMFRNLSTIGLPLSGRPSELIELALSFGFDHARRLMVSARLKSGTFHLPVQLDADDATFKEQMAALPKRLELAAATEAKRAVTSIAAASDEHSFKDFFELHRGRLHVLNFAVLRSHRRLGVGTQMMHKLYGKLTADRRSRIELEVRETNLPAQLFFRSLGYRAVTVLKDFYQDTTEDAYLMQYALPAESIAMPRRMAG